MIYLDNNATAAPDPAVTTAMLPFLSTAYGNPSSTHRFGQEARQAVEQARHQVAALLGCTPHELIFTSGGTEADNAAIQGTLVARAPRKVIVTSSVEHSAIREPLAVLEKAGREIVRVPVSVDGTLDMASLAATLARRAGEIALVSIMWANNETGVVFDVAAIGGMCREQRVPLHVDAVQAAGKVAMRVAELPVDLMSISGHKFHGPKGVGALYVRRGVRWAPFIRGGPQERDRRGGTENVPGIVGMGVAAELAGRALERDSARIAGLRERLEAGILGAVPETHVIGNRERRVANTTNLAFAGLEAEAVLLLLSEQEICTSAGAACSSGSLEPSPVLRAMGVPERVAHGAVRFSLSRFTTGEEIEETVRVVPGLIARLRKSMQFGG